MEARIFRALKPAVLASSLTLFSIAAVDGAGYRTANFTVDAPTPQLAKEIGDTAEHWRRELSQEWLGKSIPNWSKPCPIKAKVAPNLGAGGATSFVFDGGEVFGWRMNIQGSRERVLDSVLPHEVTHTIFASHFREPLPRWADEGACTTVEHKSEVSRQESMLITFLRERRGIPFSRMFAMKEYPKDVLPLYAQGHSLSHFLIAQRGKPEFVEFLTDGLDSDDWIGAIERRYGYPNLLVLQNSWMDWIREGRPPLELASDVQVASHEAPTPGPMPTLAPGGAVVRGQDPGSGVRSASASVYGAGSKSRGSNGRDDSSVTPGRPTAAVAQNWPAGQGAPAGESTASVYDASRVGDAVRR